MVKARTGARSTTGWLARCALGAGIALQATACVGLPTDVEYPDVSDVDLDDKVLTPEGDEGGELTLSEFKFGPKACEKVDLHMVTETLDQEDLNRYFAAHGIKLTAKKARADLYWYELPSEDGAPPVRLRLAILKDRNAAAKDLHDSLLQHGPGWWGVRRSNLALLAPKADLSEAVQVAIKYKLACWGMFTYAGVDDAYVVAGAYSEF